MASAREAKEWAANGGLHGIGDSLYTPFCGVDGAKIDWDAYRTLVRYCVGTLHHDMLWLTSGVGEWWSLTMGERMRLLEHVDGHERDAVARQKFLHAQAARAAGLPIGLDRLLRGRVHGPSPLPASQALALGAL